MGVKFPEKTLMFFWLQQAYYASNKVDTNGYAPMNGARPGYKTNGRVTTSIGKDQPEQQVCSYVTSSSGVLRLFTS